MTELDQLLRQSTELSGFLMFRRYPLLCLMFALVFALMLTGSAAVWQIVETEGKPNPRHQAGFLECGGRFFLLGGRNVQAIDIYDPTLKKWSKGAIPPYEVHHFQPVKWKGLVYVAASFTAGFPLDQPLPNILVYNPAIDLWITGAEIPVDRRRGGAGAVIHEDILYLIAGQTNGHWDGNVPWLDAINLKTGQWIRLPNAPRARDHFQAAVIDGKIYAAGGRFTSASTNHVCDLAISEVDVYDIAKAEWTVLPSAASISKPRADTVASVVDKYLIISDGESMLGSGPHTEFNAFDTLSMSWTALPSIEQAHRSSGPIVLNGSLWVMSGSDLDLLTQLALPHSWRVNH